MNRAMPEQEPSSEDSEYDEIVIADSTKSCQMATSEPAKISCTLTSPAAKHATTFMRITK
jgi:hypothetical protein